MAGTTTRRVTWMTAELVGLLRLVRSALDEAAGALLDTATDSGERARAAAQLIGSVRRTMEEDAGAFTPASALPGPELAPVLLGAHAGTELEGLTDVVVQLVELAWQRRGRTPLPSRALMPLREMAATSLELVEAAASALERPGRTPSAARPGAADLVRHQHMLCARLLAGDEPVDSADAVDAVLISCRLARAGHHAESVIAQSGLLAGPMRER